VLLAVPLGVFAARRPHGLPQRLLGEGLVVLYALPTFWVAVLLLLALAGPRSLELFPFQGLRSEGDLGGFARVVDVAWHLVLPVAVLTYPALAVLTQQLRAAMIEALGQDYVRAARARGIPERAVLYRHALRNALLPLITSVGSLLPHLVGGSLIVERVFGIPGMGLLAFDAIATRDYPTLMAATTLGALATLLSVLAADLLLAQADPRIRLEGAR
jgi:peptide/nickel transport system permease protein